MLKVYQWYTTTILSQQILDIHELKKKRACAGGSGDKESARRAGDLGVIPGLRRFPGRGHGNPLQYSCLESRHGQRSLAGYSPRGHKESNMTERLSTARHSTKACHYCSCGMKKIHILHNL